jgi:Mce-associated membrane protein
MPLRKLPAEALDADKPRVRVPSALAHSSVAEAAELARVEAHAEAARARAVRLRQVAEAASGDPENRSRAEDTDSDDAGVTLGEREAESAPSVRRWLHRPSRKAMTAAAGLVVICASLMASGYVVWHHHDVAQQRQRGAEFATAARNAVVAMMSIDATKVRDDLQHFADDTTGSFKVGILMGAEGVVKQIEQSKISVKAAVQAVAVQSMTEDSAVVLVAAKSELSKSVDDSAGCLNRFRCRLFLLRVPSGFADQRRCSTPGHQGG